jgi:hypothetical protein
VDPVTSFRQPAPNRAELLARLKILASGAGPDTMARLKIVASGPRTEHPIGVRPDSVYEEIARRCGADTADFCRRMDVVALEIQSEMQAIVAMLRELCEALDRDCREMREQGERAERRSERLIAYLQRRAMRRRP